MDKVVHFEIPVNDPVRAKKFYSDTFGWETTEYPELDYTVLTTVPIDENRIPKESGAINGGMYIRDENLSKAPVIVIGVSSVDESVQKVESTGCRVVKPKSNVGEMGLYAQVEDTEGNIIGLWEDLPQDS